jgi:hypothetical protein
MSNFFKRWSSLKAENTVNKPIEPSEGQKSLVTDKAILDNPLPISNADHKINEGLLEEQSPEDITQSFIQQPSLEDVDKLTAESDFSTFMNKDVAGDVHQAAMKKLFSNPHFNVMDGLDIYIDDYSIEDPLPLGMLEKMYQSTALGLFKPLEVDATNSDHSALVPSNDLLSELETQTHSENNSEANAAFTKTTTTVDSIPHQEQFDFTISNPIDQNGEALQETKNLNNIEVEVKDDHTGL